MPRRHSGSGSVVLAHGVDLSHIEEVLSDLVSLLRELRVDWRPSDMTKARAQKAEVSSPGPATSLAPEPVVTGGVRTRSHSGTLTGSHRRSAPDGTHGLGL